MLSIIYLEPSGPWIKITLPVAGEGGPTLTVVTERHFHLVAGREAAAR